jgi:hypothetical protein
MIPINFPPGVTNLLSKNAKIANWRETHLVRWDNATTMRPVLGWEKLNLGPFASRLRKMHRWQTNEGITLYAYLCEQHCYVEIDGVLNDISPTVPIVGPPLGGGGYGDYLYGQELYGTPRPGESRISLYTSIYSLDNWGEELRVMSSNDGRYLGWKPDTPAVKLAPIINAPTGNRSFVITPERHAMLFGMNDSAKFGWSDEENDTNWAFADILSRARYYDIYPKSPIITQLVADYGIIMFTTTMTYVIEWVGLPYVYSYRPIGKISIPISPSSVCNTPEGTVWPGVDGWWIFDGNVERTIECPVWDSIQSNMNITRARYTACCVNYVNKGEIWWFYPDYDCPQYHNNRYVMWDYRSGVWAMGKLDRICGYTYANDVNPMMSDGISVFKHETGFNYDGAEMPWIESQNLAVDGGEHMLTVKRILPDVSGDQDAIRWRMAKYNTRNGYGVETYSPQRKKNGSGFVDIRETAQNMRLRMDMVSPADWGTVGPILFDSTIRGKK